MSSARWLVGCGLLVVTAACGGQISGGGQGGSSGGGEIGVGKGGGGSGGGAVGDGVPLVACMAYNPIFPDFDKTCAVNEDCALVFHQVNCCGTRRALGIAVSELSSFASAEATCEAQYPPCKCLQLPTKAEDGEAGDEASMMVECASGKCLSYVP